jgi:hypothetical protein
LRAKFEKAPIESLHKNPLARHKHKKDDELDIKESDNKTGEIKSSSCSSKPPSTIGFSIFERKTDPAVSTRKESRSQNKRTNPAAPPSTSSDKLMVGKQQAAAGFAIFEENAPVSKEVKIDSVVFEEKLTEAEIASENDSAAVAFTVFTDTDLDAKKTVIESSGGFKIFSDEATFPSKFKELSGVSMHEDNIVLQKVSEKTLTAIGQVKLSQEEEDDEIMGVLGLQSADAEDATINTKLAKLDIDSMFCSPGLTPSAKQNNRLQLQQTFGELSDIKEASGDYDQSIFGTLATPFANSISKMKQDGETSHGTAIRSQRREDMMTIDEIGVNDSHELKNANENIRFPEEQR